MTVTWLRAVFARELRSVRDEILAFPDDASIWATPPGIANPAGTLALHLAGNLRHFIGATLGESGYVRDRDAEFSDRTRTRNQVVEPVEAAIAEVDAALAALDPSRLDEPFALGFGDRSPATGDFLIHLATHLAYHLGQIDYHRRIVTGSADTVRAIAIPDLHSMSVS